MDIETLCRQMPKAELHLHVEGAIEPRMLLELARRNDVALPWPDEAAIRQAYRFSCLQDFLALFYSGCQVLQRAQDFFEVTHAYLRRAHADGIVHAEIFLSPQSHLARDVGWADMLDGTLEAMAAAQRDWGLTSGLILGLQRHHSEQEAFAILEGAMPWRDSLLGLGLGGAEVGNPPAKFARVFREAKARGLHLTAHAGEEGPAEYVRDSVEILGVERIDHGNACLEDPALVAQLTAARMPLTVCPLSNLRLQGVASLEQHPLRRMLESGLHVTVNSDDPAFFGGYLNDNLLACQQALALTAQECLTLARNSLEAAFLAPDIKHRYLDDLEEFARPLALAP